MPACLKAVAAVIAVAPQSVGPAPLEADAMAISKLGKEVETNTCVDSQGGDARPDAIHPESGWVIQRPPCADEHALESVAIEFVSPSLIAANVAPHES